MTCKSQGAHTYMQLGDISIHLLVIAIKTNCAILSQCKHIQITTCTSRAWINRRPPTAMAVGAPLIGRDAPKKSKRLKAKKMCALFLLALCPFTIKMPFLSLLSCPFFLCWSCPFLPFKFALIVSCIRRFFFHGGAEYQKSGVRLIYEYSKTRHLFLASHGAECYCHSFPTLKTHPTFILNVIRSQRLP